MIINFGDWGLGIGDWAIPNPQSPIPKFGSINIAIINKLTLINIIM